MMKEQNLLFVYTDQQTAQTMGAYGNNQIETPNLDRLAETGAVFSRAYCTQPVCTPSRSSILSGLYPHTNGCIDNSIPLAEDIPSLPEIGEFEGYRTAHYGKWHLGDEIFAQHGFQEWRSILDKERRFYSPERDQTARSTYHHFLAENGFAPDIEEGGRGYFSRSFAASLPEKYSKPAYLAGEACSFLQKNRDNPFILYLGFFEPHGPNTSCRDNQYDWRDIPLPENFVSEPGDDLPLKTRLFRRLYEGRTEEDWKKEIAKYWGLVSLVDTHLGRVLETLEDCGLEDNTIVVFTSDHGNMTANHGLWGKCVMFEESVHIPLLFRIPGITRPGQRVEQPVSQIDLVPTLLAAMNQPSPDHLEGSSWLPFLKDESSLEEENVIIEWNGDHPWGDGRRLFSMAEEPDWDGPKQEEIESAIIDPIRTIITPEGWKYSHSQRGEHELYNLQDDPGETCNLVGDREAGKVIKLLCKLLKNWQKKTGDTVPISR